MTVRTIGFPHVEWDGKHTVTVEGVAWEPAMRAVCTCGWRGAAHHASTRAESTAAAKADAVEHHPRTSDEV